MKIAYNISVGLKMVLIRYRKTQVDVSYGSEIINTKYVSKSISKIPCGFAPGFYEWWGVKSNSINYPFKSIPLKTVLEKLFWNGKCLLDMI